MKSLALGLAFKMRFKATRKWSIVLKYNLRHRLEVFDGLSCVSRGLPRKMKKKKGHLYCTHCRFSALTGNNRSLELSLVQKGSCFSNVSSVLA